MCQKQNTKVDRSSALAKHWYVGNVFTQQILLSRVQQQKRVNQEPCPNYNDNGDIDKYGKLALALTSKWYSKW